MAAQIPLPDVPIDNPQTGTISQIWYEFFQGLKKITAGVGLSGGTDTGTIAVNLSTLTNSLGADVALNNIANYFDGPSVSQGVTGTWLVFGTVTVTDTTAAFVNVKLLDGTTVIAATTAALNASFTAAVSLSGIITSPAGNLRISCRDTTNTTGKILFNNSGTSKDSTITAMRIA